LKRSRNIFANIDWVTVALYLLLITVGWLSIYSATFDQEQTTIFNLNTSEGKQLFFVGLSIFTAIVILIFDTKFFTTFAYFIYGAIILLLVGVLFFGATIKGSKSWIKIGSFGLQPAEFAKFAVSLALAKFFSGLNVNIKTNATKIALGVIIGIPAVLILLQGDTGSMLVFSSFILVLFREGLPAIFLIAILVIAIISVLALVINKYILLIVLALSCFAFFFLLKRQRNIIPITAAIFLFCSAYIFSVDYVFNEVLRSHQRDRIEILLGKRNDLKGAGYNLNQSLIAIGSGSTFGKGYLKGTQTKFNFVPEQSTDFIFCTIGEELGFLGSAGILLIFFGLLYRIIFLAERQRSKFSRVYAYCVVSILFFHIAINVGMTIGLVPVIGIPFPFISYGGSSLLAFTVLLFILIKLDSDRVAVLR
jgi:rod shape determining protein RodA